MASVVATAKKGRAATEKLEQSLGEGCDDRRWVEPSRGSEAIVKASQALDTMKETDMRGNLREK